MDAVVAEVVDSFEQVWRERGELDDRVEHLEADLVRHRELEALLRSTLVSAERAAHELKDQAKRESELVLLESRAEARRIVREAEGERERLLSEARRIRGLLASALALTDDAAGPEEGEAPAEAA